MEKKKNTTKVHQRSWVPESWPSRDHGARRKGASPGTSQGPARACHSLSGLRDRSDAASHRLAVPALTSTVVSVVGCGR